MFLAASFRTVRCAGLRLVLILVMWSLAVATAPLQAQDARPARAGQVSQFGVTWTFDREYAVGQFITGDWWVVGPVRIVAIEPACARQEDGRVVNGSMIDPVIGPDSGFDSAKRYKAELNVALNVSADRPLVVRPGSSLLSAISNADGKKDERVLDTIAVLTVMDKVPPADAFRPPYVAGAKRLHRFSDVDTAKLPRLKVVGEPPSWEAVNKLVVRPFIDVAPNWNRYHMTPKQNGAPYGRDTSKQMGQVSLMLMADFPIEQKQTALIGIIQRGIDLHGIFRYWDTHRGDCPFPWRSDGGHSSGRKWPIIFAGVMLGDDDMQSIARVAPHHFFHEDGQTVYVTQQHIDLTNSERWKPPYDGKKGTQPYSQAMLGMPEWVGNLQPERGNACWTGHPYRLGGNQNAFHGMALAVLAMGLTEQWNHDAFFDYQTRYTAIMDSKPDPFAALLGYEPVEGSIKEGGWPGWQQHWDRWQYDMWHEHWPTYYRLPSPDDLVRRAAHQNTPTP